MFAICRILDESLFVGSRQLNSHVSIRQATLQLDMNLILFSGSSNATLLDETVFFPNITLTCTIASGGQPMG